MKRILLCLLLALSTSFGFSQAQCDTCFDVNGDVTALTFINDSILAVAGDFDSLVRVESGIIAWDIEKDSLIEINGLYGWIYSVQECDNGLEYWSGSFVYNGQAGNLILVDSNQVLGIRRIDELGTVSIHTQGNRLYYRESNKSFKRTKINSLEDDEAFNASGLRSYSKVEFFEYNGSLYFHSNIWQEGNSASGTAMKFDTATKVLTLWFDLERDFTIPGVRFNGVQYITNGLFMLNAYGYKLGGFSIEEKDEFLMIDTNGLIIRTQDSIFQPAGIGYTAKLFRKYRGVHDGYVYFNTGDYSQGTPMLKINKVKLDDSDSTHIVLDINAGQQFRRGKSIFVSEHLSLNGQPASSYYLIVDEDLTGYSLLPNLNFTRRFSEYASHASSSVVYPDFYGVRTNHEGVKNLFLYDVSTNQVLQEYSVQGSISCLSNQQGNLYIGGEFTSIAGQAASNFAILNTTNQSLNTTSIQTNEEIKDMVIIQDSLWLAGSFSQINTTQAQGLACLSLSNFSVLKTIEGFDSVEVLGANSGYVYAKGLRPNPNGYYRPWLNKISRTTLDTTSVDSSFFWVDYDSFFGAITSLTKNANQNVLGLAGYSHLSDYSSAGFSIYNSDLSHPIKQGIVSGSCEADYPDPFYEPSRIGAVASKGGAAVFNPGAEAYLSLNWEQSFHPSGPFILHQDSKVQPLLPLTRIWTHTISCVIEPNAISVSDNYIATGNGAHSSYGWRYGDGVRFLNIHTSPEGRNALSGPLMPMRFCQSEENVTFDFQLIKENDNANVFWGITAGGNVIDETDMDISTSDSLQFQLTIPEFMDTGLVILKYGVVDAHYGEISNELEIEVLETPETPLLNIVNGEVFSNQTGYAHAWFTEGGEYIGWNLPYLPLDPNYNQYSVVAIHENGCVSDTSSAITVGLDENKQPEVVIFPNPAKNEVWIKGIIKPEEVFVYDISGRIVISSLLQQNESLDISKLLPGVYSIQVNSEVFPLVIR